MPVQNLQDKILSVLEKEFKPLAMEVTDDSARHQGHAGARESGGSHFRLFLVSEHFKGMSLVQKHRAVYSALAGLMHAGIHALQMEVLTPDEWRQP